MKSLFLVIFIFLAIPAVSQLLSGEWYGKFSYIPKTRADKGNYPVTLKFELKDNKYSVYSYSTGVDSNLRHVTVVCKVFYQLTAPDSIYLEDLEVIQPSNALAANFQRMFLKIKKRKKETILDGRWEGAPSKPYAHGRITFRRKQG